MGRVGPADRGWLDERGACKYGGLLPSTYRHERVIFKLFWRESAISELSDEVDRIRSLHERLAA